MSASLYSLLTSNVYIINTCSYVHVYVSILLEYRTYTLSDLE